MKLTIVVTLLLQVLLAELPAVEAAGVMVRLDSYAGPASVATQSIEPFKFEVVVDPKSETKPLTVRVELPKSGRNVWPANDVEVRDSAGEALLVRRSGIEWSTLLIPLPAGVTRFRVQAMPPPDGWPRSTTDKDRTIEDVRSGWSLRVARWSDGRAAALSIRFDDSHPTHLTKAVPILREYGFRGTFIINPGASEPGSRRVSNFEQQRAEWEAVAKAGDHELANHSARHRGAIGDEDMEREIGEAAQTIWELTPGRSKLMALNLGGGTRWETTRTLRHYLDKHHQFDASSGSLGMDDSYGGRVAAFRTMLEQHLKRGLWCRIHYHYIGDGLSSSEANFRAALDIAKEHRARLWIAGMADIHKYQTERDASKLSLEKSDPRSLTFRLTCQTEATLYDQPLTLEILRAPSLDAQRIVVKDAQGKAVASRAVEVDGAKLLRFEVPPRDGSYSIEHQP